MFSKTDMERLALMQAMYNALGEQLATSGGKNGAPNARTEANDYLTGLYLNTGADRINIKINGQKVGTLSLSFTKPKDGVEPEIVDARELLEWLRSTDGGRDTLMRLIHGEPGLVLKAAIADGELPDGCAMRKVCEPSRIKDHILRVNMGDVAKAYGNALRGACIEMLGLPSAAAEGVEADA